MTPGSAAWWAASVLRYASKLEATAIDAEKYTGHSKAAVTVYRLIALDLHRLVEEAKEK